MSVCAHHARFILSEPCSGLSPFHLVLPWGTMGEEWPCQCHLRDVGEGADVDSGRLDQQPRFQPLLPSVRPFLHVDMCECAVRGACGQDSTRANTLDWFSTPLCCALLPLLSWHLPEPCLGTARRGKRPHSQRPLEDACRLACALCSPVRTC